MIYLTYMIYIFLLMICDHLGIITSTKDLRLLSFLGFIALIVSCCNYFEKGGKE